MTISDYLVNLALVALVVLQVRGHAVTRARLLFPLVMTVVVGTQFLHGVPTSGNDLVLVATVAGTGAILGVLAAATTSVRRQGSVAFAKAGVLAAVLWVIGVGARVGFSFWVSHGGLPAVARFSAQHHITSASAWAAAFVLMALAEVVARTGVLALKTLRCGAEIPRGGILQGRGGSQPSAA